MGRRQLSHRPQVLGRSWPDVQKDLQDLIDNIWDMVGGGDPNPHAGTHNVSGSDPLTTPGTPASVVLGVAGAAGAGPAHAREDHAHGLDLATSGIPDAYVLTRDSTDPRGVKWAAQSSGGGGGVGDITGAEFLAWMGWGL